MMFRALLAAALLLSSQLAMALSYTVQIPEKDLQKMVSAMMPIEKKNYLVTVIFSKPKVDLYEGSDKIGVAAKIKAIAVGGVQGTGSAKISGTLKYNASKGEFYFKNPKIEQLEINQVPNQFIPEIKNIAQQLVTQVLATQPIFKLNDNDVKQKLAKSVLQSVAVKNEILFVVLNVF
jgi:hypothetical protein